MNSFLFLTFTAFVISPSAYGERRTRFTFIANDSKYLQIIPNSGLHITALLNEIDSRMKHLDGKRAVIVFFPHEKKLNEFIEAGRKQLEDRGHYVQKMSTLDTASERNARIRGAVTSGTVTLAAADFGRGTDFVAFDKGLNARGGIHVIQTFFSRERTEEVQIQGRTARNTNNGSYSMVLNAEDLVRDFPALTSKRIEEIIASGKAYDELDAIRLARCDEELKKNSIAGRDIDLHHESMELREGNVEKIKSYLKKYST